MKSINALINKKVINQIESIVQEYCESFDIKHSDLYKGIGTGGRARIYKGINLSMIRTSLSYYLYEKYPLTALQVSQLVGYTDHSMVIHNRRRAGECIDVNDELFINAL